MPSSCSCTVYVPVQGRGNLTASAASGSFIITHLIIRPITVSTTWTIAPH